MYGNPFFVENRALSGVMSVYFSCHPPSEKTVQRWYCWNNYEQEWGHCIRSDPSMNQNYILAAIKRKDTEKVLQLIHVPGYDINYATQRKITPLILASKLGWVLYWLFLIISTIHILTHFTLNKLPHTIFWKSTMSVLGMSGSMT